MKINVIDSSTNIKFDYEFKFTKEINEVMELIIVTAKMLDFKIESKLYDGACYMLFRNHVLSENYDEVIIDFWLNGESKFWISFTYLEENYEISEIRIATFKNEFEVRKYFDNFEDRLNGFYQLFVKD